MNDDSRLVFDVRGFGAKGSGERLDTQAFQAAIDACAEDGGLVRVGPGRYVVGTIKLRSNVELHVEEGAEILGSTSLDDYSGDNQGAVEAPEFNKCLIYAENARNISITGKGTINGRGAKANFPTGRRGRKLDRPMLIRFVGCTDVTFTDITLRDSGSWCTHLVECDNITARRVTIDTHVNANNDGVDLDGCANVLIEDCDIRSGDDAVCPKSTTRKLCENIVVRNCRITSNTAAFKCGTSSLGGFRNISFTDCEITDTRMGVIKLLLVDGGILEDITISNLTMRNVEGPIFIRLGNRGRPYDVPITQVQHKDAAHEGVPTGRVKGIRISNIRAQVVSEERKRWGIMIAGLSEHPVEDVLLEDIEVSFPGGGTAEEAQNIVPEDETRYPEQFFFGTLPSWGAYVRHARHVEFRNVNLQTRAPDQRQRLILDDVEGFAEC